MNDHNRNMLNLTSKVRESASQIRSPITLSNIESHIDCNNNIEIQRFNLTNIFEENSYLLQIKHAFEHQNDPLSAIHCTNIIDKLPILCDFEVYKLHVKWFCDEFIVYATDLPCGITVAHSEHLQRKIQEQLHKHQIHIVGLIENPL